MAVNESIIEATRNRIRPIFMSTLTSLFGLVPLVIFPGAGSELYRGIGTVVFGGFLIDCCYFVYRARTFGTSSQAGCASSRKHR
ncbi:MAG: hypothetical protein CM15mP117_17770 [Alphaproteobacteria bacterium]|nr:MAG: hypothetical protein CM15mP117_17770 [Alphaproteobacteria bacterium]